MANLLQSTQTKSTTAPGYYTDYLSDIASRGKEAQQGASFVGAQPLQEKAFNAVCQNFGTGQGAITTGQNYVGQAAGQDITGAATPFLTAATTSSPLCAARPMICQSANLNIACLAGQYMSPYLQKAMQSVSDIGQRNIRQNLSPMATAAAVGSGQFGSQRGAQVLGQVQAQAQQDINKQLSEMANTGYAQALQAAQAKQSALGQAAGQIASAQQAQNTANLTAGQTAACAAAKEAGALTSAGQTMGTLGQTGAAMNLACINAASTLGGQQQTIAQNEENFPLTTLQSLASLLQGYSIPTSTSTQLEMSPLSAMGAIGAGGLGLFTPKYNSAGVEIPNSSPWDVIKRQFGGTGGGAGAGAGGAGGAGGVPSDPGQSTGGGGAPDNSNPSPTPDLDPGSIASPPPDLDPGADTGGFAIPDSYYGCCVGGFSSVPNASGGLIKSRAVGGRIGCASTRSLGGLPYKRG